jgi:hypothetical protein
VGPPTRSGAPASENVPPGQRVRQGRRLDGNGHRHALGAKSRQQGRCISRSANALTAGSAGVTVTGSKNSPCRRTG